MAVFEIEGPDGKRFEIEAPDQQSAFDAFSQFSAGNQTTPEPQTAPEPRTIATTNDGGRIYEQPDGTRGFTSPGYSTTDPDTVARLMEGATPADVVQDSFDNQRIDANQGRARLNEFARGVPFVGSYADEAVGIVNPQAGENMQALSGAMQRQRPGETAALNVGGAIAGAVPMAMVAAPTLIANAGKTVGVRALQAAGLSAAAGAVEGAVYGAGEGEGAERMQNAKDGAIFGGAVGAVGGPLATYGAEGVKAILRRTSGSDVSVIASQLGISKEAATVVRNALRTGGINDAMDALQRGGDSAMLADANGATMGLLDSAAQAGGNAGAIAGRAVGERTSLATNRLTAALDDALGAPQGQGELVGAIRQGSAPARQAAYDAAYAAPIDYSTGRGQAIEGLLKRVPPSAIRRADELMRLEGVESGQILASIADDGTVSYSKLPDVRQLDYITRALNDVAENANAQGKLGGTTDLGRLTGNLSRQIRSSLREAVPEYGNALDTAADAISQRNATDLGYDLLKTGTRREAVREGLQGASEAEKAAAMQGVRSYLDEVTANVTRTITDGDTTSREGIRLLRDFSSRANEQKLRLLMGGEATEKLLAEVDQAATAFELRAAIAQNSKTAVRQSVQSGIDEQTSGGVVQTLASGEPVNATKRFIQAITGETAEAQELRRLGLYEEIADVLTNTRGMRAQRALRLINKAIEGQPITEAQASYIGTVVSSSAALTADREIGQALQ